MTHARCNGRPLHLVEKLPSLLQVCNVCAIGVQSAFPVGTSRQRGDDELSSAARMHLEVETSGDGVLPELQGVVSMFKSL